MSGTDNNFKASEISIRAQKKLLSRMANKSVAKVFIDDVSSDLLDNLYKLAKAHGSKRDAEKVVKNIIKIVIKIGILYRNDQFNAEELNIAERFKQKFHNAAMTVISFYEVEFSFDRGYIMHLMGECRTLLKNLVQRSLTEKSLSRIDHVFNFFGNEQFLDDVFSKRNEHRDILGKIVADMNKLIDSGGL